MNPENSLSPSMALDEKSLLGNAEAVRNEMWESYASRGNAFTINGEEVSRRLKSLSNTNFSREGKMQIDILDVLTTSKFGPREPGKRAKCTSPL